MTTVIDNLSKVIGQLDQAEFNELFERHFEDIIKAAAIRLSWERSLERPRNVIEALARVMAELPGIGKDQESGSEGSSQRYKYRGIEAITAEAQPLLGKYGVVFVPEVLKRRTLNLTMGGKPWTEEQLKVRYRVYGPGGRDDFIVVGPIWGLGRDNSDKGTNKCLTQCFKYALLQVLCVGDRKDDADSEDPHQADAHGTTSGPADWFSENGWQSKDEHDQWRQGLLDTLKVQPAEVQAAFKEQRLALGYEWNVGASRNLADDLDAALKRAMEKPRGETPPERHTSEQASVTTELREESEPDPDEEWFTLNGWESKGEHDAHMDALLEKMREQDEATKARVKRQAAYWGFDWHYATREAYDQVRAQMVKGHREPPGKPREESSPASPTTPPEPDAHAEGQRLAERAQEMARKHGREPQPTLPEPSRPTPPFRLGFLADANRVFEVSPPEELEEAKERVKGMKAIRQVDDELRRLGHVLTGDANTRRAFLVAAYLLEKGYVPGQEAQNGPRGAAMGGSPPEVPAAPDSGS